MTELVEGKIYKTRNGKEYIRIVHLIGQCPGDAEFFLLGQKEGSTFELKTDHIAIGITQRGQVITFRSDGRLSEEFNWDQGWDLMEIESENTVRRALRFGSRAKDPVYQSEFKCDFTNNPYDPDPEPPSVA